MKKAEGKKQLSAVRLLIPVVLVVQCTSPVNGCASASASILNKVFLQSVNIVNLH